MIHLSGFSLLLCSILVYKLGQMITAKIGILSRYHIPSPVTGGLLASVFLLVCDHYFGFKVEWGLELRDQFLLIFFCTVGLNAKVRHLLSGSKTLIALFFTIAVFLFLQNSIGIGVAMMLQENPIYGLLAGSISMAGGHGTAISWGTFLEGEGYQGATEFALVAATMGLIMGGILGGPVARTLIKNHQLNPQSAATNPGHSSESFENKQVSLCIQEALKVIMVISLCIVAGNALHAYLKSTGLVMPVYLPVLLLAILFINLAEIAKFKLNQQFTNLSGDICLELFITMSLMSLNLQQLTQTAGIALVIVFIQSAFICLFAYYLIFRVSGKDYDASLITSGFIGLGLGATPVGLANVNTLTHRFAPSPKAFLVVPILGSVFTDTLNAIILQLFLSLPFIQP